MYNHIIEVIEPTRHLTGEIWECGTFQGYTALKIKRILGECKDNRTLRMFDTFTGQPFSGPYDHHRAGSMNNVNLNKLQNNFQAFSNTYIHSGIMPITFSGLENSVISIANIDVDNYDSVKACLEFIYPRMESGGYIFIDDYSCPNCPGAKKATNEFLRDKKEKISGHYNPEVYIIKQ